MIIGEEDIDRFIESQKTKKEKVKKQKDKTKVSSKRKGKAKEYEVEAILYKFGFIREPDSGIITGCDLKRVFNDKTIKYVEVKYRASGFKTLYKFLQQSKTNDVLVIQAKHEERLYILTEDKFLALLSEAGYDKFDEKQAGYDLWAYRKERRKSLKDA